MKLPLPDLCHNDQCRRVRIYYPDKLLTNPNFSWAQKAHLLADEPCDVTCHSEECGLLLRFAFCGEVGSKRKFCFETALEAPHHSEEEIQSESSETDTEDDDEENQDEKEDTIKEKKENTDPDPDDDDAAAAAATATVSVF
jgi:hypothetical protein